MTKTTTMFRMIPVLLTAIVVLQVSEPVATAQDGRGQSRESANIQEGDNGADPNSLLPAEARCFELLKKLSEDLAQQPRFELKLTNQVVIKSGTSAGADEQMRQTVELTLKMDRTAAAPRTQLLVNLAGNGPDFVIDWNKGLLTRIFLPEKIFSQTTTQDLRHDLRECQFTAENLAGAHGDFLLRPDLVEHVRHQVVHLTDVSEDKGDPHFHMELTDGREMDLWFDRRDGRMLPLKVESHRALALGENQNVDVVTTGEFIWELSPEDEINWMSLPPLSEFRRVSDLRNDMLGVDSADRIGKEIPPTTVLDMSSKEVDAAEELKAATEPTLLYFWATWAAPSLREMEEVQQFAKGLEETGVRIHPVNVGESQEAIQQFAVSRNVGFPIWRDPDGKFCAQLGILQLPAAVIVHKGQVISILEPVGPNNRDKIRATVTKLMADQ